MRQRVGVVGMLAAIVLAGAAVWQVKPPWTPQPPWPTRAARTAVARTLTAAARTPTATRTPTAALTVTPTVTPTGTMLPPVAGVETPPAVSTWTGWYLQTPPAVSSYAPRPLLTPPAMDPVTGAVWPLDAEEREYLRILNEYRAGVGAPPVVPDPSLMASAQWHATDEATYGYLSHRDRLGRDFGWRSNEFGASPYANRAEITLGGSETGWGAWNVWRHSPPHDAGQRDPRYRLVGIGRAWGPIDGWRWVVNFSEPMGDWWPTATPGPWGSIP